MELFREAGRKNGEAGMALYLNTNASLIDFRMLRNGEFFVDKSEIIEKLSKRIHTKNRFVCITKPRRFGKTSVLNMLGAYYGKAYDTRVMFDDLKISQSESYEKHLNQYNIIKFLLNELSGRGDTCSDYIGRFKRVID